MSNEAQQPPPSIAPKRPPGPAGPSGPAGVRTAEGAPARAGGAGGSGTTGTTTGTTTAPSGTPTPSLAERLKSAAGSVRGSGSSSSSGAAGSPGAGDREASRDGRPVGGTAATATGTGSASSAPSTGPRRVRLAVARVDPWSIMKLSFLLSVAVGIMIVVATAVVWYTLDGLAVFTRVNDVIATLASDPTLFDLEEYAAFDRVISLATMVAVVDIVLLTALSTIGAFLYNITAALVGGINLTLTDD